MSLGTETWAPVRRYCAAGQNQGGPKSCFAVLVSYHVGRLYRMAETVRPHYERAAAGPTSGRLTLVLGVPQ